LGNRTDDHQRTFARALALVAVGIAMGGWFVGHGFLQGRTAYRFVTVKGVYERDVVTDRDSGGLESFGCIFFTRSYGNTHRERVIFTLLFWTPEPLVS
jgi:hypothetical protein